MKYEEYKDCSVEWIGEVPSHWEVCRLKNYSKIVLGKMLMSTPPKGEEAKYTSEKYLKSRNVGWMDIYDNYDDLEDMWFNEYEKSIYQLQLNDIVMNEGGDIGKLGIWKNSEFPCYIQNSINKITANRNIIPFYLQYLLFAIAKTNYFWSIVNPISIAHLTKEKLSNTPILVPPLSEQQAIATYLDEKCEKINTAIEVQKKKIELLEELKYSIITDAVTKGLNPKAPMKDSGVEWIGEVPEHWEIMRSRFLCQIQTGDKDTINRVEDGQYPFYVRSPKVERINSYSFDGEAVLMAGDGVGAGKVFHYANCKFDYHQRVYNLHKFKNICGLYYFYYISNQFKYIIEEGGAKNTVDSVRLNMIQDFWVTIPPIQEQQAIIAHIEKEVAKIDNQISKANRRIELLEELKQSIITEAVTGKIKVC